MDIEPKATDFHSLYPEGETYFYIPPFIAHRGLWSKTRPENSLPAFWAAADTGLGIELDVRLSADGEAMVFHDSSLSRMCGDDRDLADCTVDELQSLRLAGTEHHIPTLLEVLWTLGARTPVLVEMKVPLGAEGPLEARVAEIIDMAPTPAAVLSFNPHALGFVQDIAPHIPRGLNLDSWRSHERGIKNAAQRRAYRNLRHINDAAPHFLSVSAEILPDARVASARQAGLPILGWTARSAAELNRLALYADSVMFEGVSPALIA